MAKMIKQRRDSIEQFTAGGRPELAAKEAAEIAVIEGYMPAQMSEADAKAAIAAVIKETGAAGPKDMGKVMARAEGQVRRPDGLRQGQRPHQGPAEVATAVILGLIPRTQSTLAPTARCDARSPNDGAAVADGWVLGQARG